MIQLAGCVVRDAHDRVLLVHRATSDLTQWEIPGGKVEAGEDPQAAAVREIKEELAIDVTVTSKLGTSEFDFRGLPYEYHYYAAEITDGKPVLQESMHDDLAYVELDSTKHHFAAGIQRLKDLRHG